MSSASSKSVGCGVSVMSVVLLWQRVVLGRL